MKYAEFRRWLAGQGVRFEEGARHTKLHFRDRQSTLPRHSGEIGEGLRKAILRQLGIAESKR